MDCLLDTSEWKKLSSHTSSIKRNFNKRKLANYFVITVLFVIAFVILELYFEDIFFSSNGHNPLSDSSTKQVLLWTTMYRFRSMDAWHHQGGLPKDEENCRFKCSYTTRVSELNNSDAIIYHGWPENNGSMFPLPRTSTRNPNQVWVYLSREPALYHSNIYETLDDFYEFNWTMTYRSDSDIHIPYGKFENVPMDTSSDDIEFIRQKANLKSNGSLAAAMISNCKSLSGREEYIKKLKKVIPIDIYGSCGSLKCDGDFYKSPFQSNCYKTLGRKYKFWLSFENALCHDYVSEKIYFPLQYGSLPVYLGYPENPKNLPVHSFIHTKYFETPEKLGEYLLYLDSHPEKYLEYFTWRNNSRVIMEEEQSVAWCTLCQKLHEINPGNHKSYKKVADWFLRNNTEELLCIGRS